MHDIKGIVYNATVWHRLSDKPGERITVIADDLDDAERQLKLKYGDAIDFSLHNEDEADKPR
jgi:hypothetical protein